MENESILEDINEWDEVIDQIKDIDDVKIVLKALASDTETNKTISEKILEDNINKTARLEALIEILTRITGSVSLSDLEMIASDNEQSMLDALNFSDLSDTL